MLFDLFLNLNTGVLKKGNLIKTRTKIALNYFQKKFMIDLLSIIPIFFNYIDFLINNDDNSKTSNKNELIYILFFLKSFQLS